MTTCNNNYVFYQWGINHIISTQSIEHMNETQGGACSLGNRLPHPGQQKLQHDAGLMQTICKNVCIFVFLL